jgi:serpin B
MFILLPVKRCGLREVEASLTYAKLRDGLAGLREREAREAIVVLPRFQFRTQLSLSDSLRRSGMALPFSDQADFSGITPQTRLVLDNVIQSASVEVDETGTVATAATAVIMPPSLPDTVAVNHPFLFGILDHKLGTFLFFGRVEKP